MMVGDHSRAWPFTFVDILPPDPNVYEVRAIVLSKMGQHRQALDIYVFKLRDSEKAEE